MQSLLLLFEDSVIVGLIRITEMPGESLAFLEDIRRIAVTRIAKG